MTEWVTDYINFCVDTIPTRTMRCFLNNNLWITSDLKDPLKKKKSFQRGRQEIIDFSSSFNTIQPDLLCPEDSGGGLNNLLDQRLPDKQTTVCETEGLCV
ncbi:hypothetical protein ATANTOWER_008453 [Ataeniobius toweri]|uniref:Uncharacterized protein n=1 Tax=Ataeniobius toweri TaxID=208326 RepID=A0ABU7CHG2_9TELE|nr:hypothetical protein [Ataeniobius toweri]